MEIIDCEQGLSANRYASRVGERVGDLVLVGVAQHRADNGRVLGRFQCDCGNEIIYAAGRILNNKRRAHCGCKTDRGTHRTHGMHGSPEYSSWRSMKLRCLSPESKDFKRWGGCGIDVHPEWSDSFEAFYAHIGPRPKGTTLDRIDNTLGYVPGNVRWARSKEQAENRNNSWFVSVNGTVFSSLYEAAANHGVSATTIVRWCDGYEDKRRLARGRVPAKDGCFRWRKYAD